MKFWRNGFWQKAVTMICVLLEFALVIAIVYFLTAGSLNGNAALYVVVSLFLANFGIGVFIVNSAAEEEYKTAWLFFLVAVPVVGALFYLMFAHKLRTKKQKAYLHRYYSVLKVESSREETLRKLKAYDEDSYRISRFIEHGSEGDCYLNSAVTYFPLGDDAFPEMKKQLEKARHYIFVEFFIIKPGKMWDEILEILVRKAKSGVDVRVVYDDVGNLGATPVGYDKKLCEMGIKARVFRKIKPLLDIRMNNRDHRKIMVIDGHTAFTGGINLADEYINAEERFGHWKDSSIMVKGKAVHGYVLLFLALWKSEFAPDEAIDYEYYRSERFIDEAGGFPVSDGFVQPYGELPYSDTAVGVGVYQAILARAKDYVYISTPYLVLNARLRDSICLAAESGVDVRLLTPGIPDKKAVYELTRSEYGPLLKAGVKIYEYTPGFVHQKMFVSDDKWATEGTINLDYRSLYLHLENGTFIVGSRAVKDMKDDFLLTIEKSRQVTSEEYRKMKAKKKFLWVLLRLVAPLL